MYGEAPIVDIPTDTRLSNPVFGFIVNTVDMYEFGTKYANPIANVPVDNCVMEYRYKFVTPGSV